MSPDELMMQQRRFNQQQTRQAAIQGGYANGGANNTLVKCALPPELERQYTVIVTPGGAKVEHVKLREIKANNIGALVCVRGIVTRCSDVKPAMQVAVYACEACGNEVYQVVHGKEFTPLSQCPSQKCEKNQVKGNLNLQIKQSKFVAF